MAIRIEHQPSAGVVGVAGFAAGLGKRKERERQQAAKYAQANADRFEKRREGQVNRLFQFGLAERERGFTQSMEANRYAVTESLAAKRLAHDRDIQGEGFAHDRQLAEDKFRREQEVISKAAEDKIRGYKQALLDLDDNPNMGPKQKADARAQLEALIAGVPARAAPLPSEIQANEDEKQAKKEEGEFRQWQKERDEASDKRDAAGDSRNDAASRISMVEAQVQNRAERATEITKAREQHKDGSTEQEEAIEAINKAYDAMDAQLSGVSGGAMVGDLAEGFAEAFVPGGQSQAPGSQPQQSPTVGGQQQAPGTGEQLPVSVQNAQQQVTDLIAKFKSEGKLSVDEYALLQDASDVVRNYEDRNGQP